ncbi:membrane metallo-endopeptidase-like 1 isoform X2 [Daphnia carinata]|uniref:membrane metallo-endopeptidase-like 1 isoform X2 n=1 Tax=Daphnia carinata TaxID=120202 RepID=UPI00257DA53C|nr:membrane metallo-endopeptidase-like 1 isoform X2 [Daphnia carinata]
MEIESPALLLISDLSEEHGPKIKCSRRPLFTSVRTLVGAVGFVIVITLIVTLVLRFRRETDSVNREQIKNIFDQQEERLNPEVPAVPVCSTKECKLSAAALLESMDETADPCENFYQFACGGWQKKNFIRRGSAEISQFSILRGRIDRFIEEFFMENNTEVDSKATNNTRDMYNACLDLNSIEKLGIMPLVKILDSYGQWPMTVSNWTENRFDWRKASASIRNTFGKGFLFYVSNFVDANDTDFSVIYVDQPSLGVPIDLLTDEEIKHYHSMDYFRFIFSVAISVRDAIDGGAHEDDINNDIGDMIRFHSDLANIMTLNEPDWKFSRHYNPFSLDELQAWTDRANATNSMGKINWHEHLTDIYSIADVSINPDEKIVVSEPEYLPKLLQLLDQTSPRVIANFIHWRLVLEHIYHLNDKMRAVAYEFNEAIFEGFPIPSREDWCKERVKNVMGLAISAKYVEKSFDPQTKIDMKEMIHNLKRALGSLVQDSNWMDEETKINVIEKAAAMKEFIGYPDWMTNRTALDLAYQGIIIKPFTHFDNYLSAKRIIAIKKLRFVRFTTNTDDDNSWISFPTVVNAFYYPILNSITVPAGILQPPFYGRGRLAATNYGAIGAVIGHELTHGFHSEGYKTDKKGHKISGWTNHTLEEFQKKKQCFVDQYNHYIPPELKKTNASHVNGRKTRNENIADNVGLREAFRAYKHYVARNGPENLLPGLERYTPEQIFFLSFANVECSNGSPASLEYHVRFDVHTPSRYRIIGSLSNSDDFSQHYKCTPGSPMNPSNKCTVW